VEATGVELFRVLITRNLLILGTATTAKKAPLPDPLYVYCTKMFFALESDRPHSDPGPRVQGACFWLDSRASATPKQTFFGPRGP